MELNTHHLRPAEFDVALQLQSLRDWMERIPGAVVAYSGGVDSALVLAVANEVLGTRAVGCIGVSPSYPGASLTPLLRRLIALAPGIALVETQEHLDPRYAANPGNRCYFCKSELYERLAAVAEEEGGAVILDGTNASDLKDHRPGYAAARERGVRSPLAELGFGKSAVRDIARALSLNVWDKPASPCLASRVPTGTPIVPLLLNKIEQAENVLARLGFAEFRVRHHGDVARIEVPLGALPRVIAHQAQILDGVRAAGYRFVSLDLGGLQSGSLSASPPQSPRT